MKIGALTASGLFAGGLWADATDRWEGHAYLLNAASSFTAFAIGAPIAIVLFRRIGGTLETEITRRDGAIIKACTIFQELTFATEGNGQPHQHLFTPEISETVASLVRIAPSALQVLVEISSGAPPDRQRVLLRQLSTEVHSLFHDLGLSMSSTAESGAADRR